MSRGFERPPLWAIAAIVIGSVFLAVGLPFALTRGPGERGAAASAVSAGQTQAAAPTITLPQDPRLMVFGDSYTVGYDARPLEKGWAYLVGQQLGWPTQVEGLSGTGLTWAGTGTVRQTYTQRLAGLTTSANPAPNVLVIQGGQNDYRASAGEIRDALVALIAQARTAWPGVQIAVVGPAGPFPLVNTLGRIDAAYAAGAAAGGAPYISPVQEKWFTESNSPEYAIADGAHVNTAGHAYMAEKFLLAFSKVTGGAIKPPAG